MPKALVEADRKIHPNDPKHLEALFVQDSKRMLGFRDWPESALTRVQVPVLVLVGDRDIVTVAHAEKMRSLFPKGRLAVLPGNHGSYLGEASGTEDPASSMPEVTAALVTEFLGL